MNAKKKPHSIIPPTTKQFMCSAWHAQKNPPWDFIHSYFYARWPYLYISLGKGEHPLVKKLAPIFKAWRRLFPRSQLQIRHLPSTDQATGTVADIYHGKVMPLKLAQELMMVNEPISLPDLEQVIPYVRARALIQENPDHIILVKCPCRMSESNPCLPLDVCLVIGEPFASYTIQHYPTRARWITQNEAIEILEREDTRGRVHHAFFGEMMLGRFFAICNCCSCCCTAMKAHQRGIPMLASSGFVAQVDESKCIACNTCAAYCQFGALGLESGLNHVDEELCMGCGVCVSKCSEGAISIYLEPTKGKPLEIFKLLNEAGEVPVL